MSRFIGLIESSDIGAEYSAQAVRALGFEPVFFCDLKCYQADPRRQIMAHRHFDGDTSSTQSVLELIERSGIREWAGITTFADTRLKTAVEVAQTLGVRGIDPSVARLKDKGWVSSLVPEYSPATVSFDPRKVPISKLSEILQHFEGLIIKPSAGAGAIGTFRIHGFSELEQLAARIEALDLPAHLTGGSWIAQSFVPGRLVSVEGYCFDGFPRFLGFTSRRKVGATESAAAFPIDESITSRLKEQVHEAVYVLAQRSGFRRGYFHNEFILAEERAYLIDANMGRVGGGAIAQQLALAFDADPVEIFRHILSVTLFGHEGTNAELYARPPKDETYAIFYGIPKRDRLEWIEIPQGTSCYHTQILGAGNVVPPMGENDWSWIGILAGKTPEASRTIQRVRIGTPHGVLPPCY